MSSSTSTEAAQEISINVKGPSELKIQISISNDKTVMDLKRAIAEKSDVEAERQRLIYSGKVLKDEDKLASYKIQSGHTLHMVKGAARTNAASSSTPQPLPTMQAGQNPSDPLTLLNSHMGHGLMAGFNPFANLGVNPNDPNMFQGMLDSPQFMQQMSSIMSNPAIVDQIIAMNPQLQSIAPQVRQMFQSEQFRQIMSNPESLRAMMQMSSMMRQSGLGGAGGSGPGLFGGPAVGTNASANPSGAGAAPFNPSQWPPFPQPQATGAAGSTGTATGTGATGADTGTGTSPAAGLGGLPDPALLQQLLGLGGLGGGAAGGGFPGLFGAGSPPATAQPADLRPPEERFQVQLQQLQDMGFTNAVQNVRALMATGGNVHSAIEYILSGGGL